MHSYTPASWRSLEEAQRPAWVLRSEGADDTGRIQRDGEDCLTATSPPLAERCRPALPP